MRTRLTASLAGPRAAGAATDEDEPVESLAAPAQPPGRSGRPVGRLVFATPVRRPPEWER